LLLISVPSGALKATLRPPGPGLNCLPFIQKNDIIASGRELMDLHQLRCFVAAAEELHFGRAAQRLEMLPSALGRFIRLLEEDLGTRLMTRTTRSVTLTDDGAVLVKDARALLAQADALTTKFRMALE
jgi:hypothetical protein